MPKNTKTADATIKNSSENASLATENSNLESTLSFEAALSELESLVQQMESDQMPLEQSLAAYKRGSDLLRFCQKNLADVEQQVRILDDKNQLQTYSANED